MKGFRLASVKALPLLSTKAAEQIVEAIPKLEIFGDWSSNATLLKEINAKLVNGDVVLIDGFLSDTVAKSLYEDMYTMSQDPSNWVDGGGGIAYDREFWKEADAASSLSTRCKAMAKQSESAFAYSHDDMKRSVIDRIVSFCERSPTECGAIAKVRESVTSKLFSQMLNLLLTGSGMRLLGPVKTLNQRLNATVTFRNWRVGQFITAQTDTVKARMLSVNYNLATPGWQPEWGGSLLWCGPRPHSGAHRYSPGFNQVAMFIPHYGSMHAVEVIEPLKKPDHFRFSFTAFLEIEGIDDHRHWQLQESKQEDNLLTAIRSHARFVPTEL